MIVLVGNKTDLNDKRQVTTEMLETRAKELGVMWMETSAKAGHNVKQLFKKVAMALPGAEQGEGSSQQATTAATTTSELCAVSRKWCHLVDC